MQTSIARMGMFSVVLLVACKSDAKDATSIRGSAGSGSAGSGSSTTTTLTSTTKTGSGSSTTTLSSGSGSNAGASLSLPPNESLYGGGPTATNLVSWQVEPDISIKLALINTGKDTDGRTMGVLRAFRDVPAPTSHDVQTYSLRTEAAWAELAPLTGGRASFRYGAAGEGRHARNVTLLRWDPATKEVRVAKRWSGATADAEPTWLTDDTYKPTAESVALCQKVVARIVACGKDPAFRDGLFHNFAADRRTAAEKAFDESISSWKSAAASKAQCERWASAEFVDTHFSDPARLAQLSADAKSSCDLFGREIEDDGGMPRAN